MVYRVLHVLALTVPSTAFPTSFSLTRSCLDLIMSAKGISKVHICSCVKSVIQKAVQIFHNEVTNANIGTMDSMMIAKRLNPVDES